MNMISNLSNGRAVIPAALRMQLDIRDGDQLIWSVRDGVLTTTTRRAQLSRAQAMFQKFVPKNSSSLADELIAARRAEAASE
jgi:bifunctional DNA-binding transcriptional regulator/antitoxin component of YhaV-PrlF toxin-antitoxin module